MRKLGLLQQSRHPLVGPEVDRHDAGRHTEAPMKLLRQCVEGTSAPAAQDHMDAIRREVLRHGATEAVGGSGHKLLRP